MTSDRCLNHAKSRTIICIKRFGRFRTQMDILRLFFFFFLLFFSYSCDIHVFGYYLSVCFSIALLQCFRLMPRVILLSVFDRLPFCLFIHPFWVANAAAIRTVSTDYAYADQEHKICFLLRLYLKSAELRFWCFQVFDYKLISLAYFCVRFYLFGSDFFSSFLSLYFM